VEDKAPSQGGGSGFPHAGRGSLLIQGLEQLQNLARLREAPLLNLGKDPFPFHDDIEDTLSSGDEFGSQAHGFLDFSGQTGRSGQVVSDRAVSNDDLHGAIMLFRPQQLHDQP